MLKLRFMNDLFSDIAQLRPGHSLNFEDLNFNSSNSLKGLFISTFFFFNSLVTLFFGIFLVYFNFCLQEVFIPAFSSLCQTFSQVLLEGVGNNLKKKYSPQQMSTRNFFSFHKKNYRIIFTDP